jgi:hypothetical protein
VASQPTVLYIVGKGRSGSTILDHVLGQVPGVVSTGELWFLWEWGVLRGGSCGCGEPVASCPVWSEVLGRLGIDEAAARDLLELQRRTMSWPRVPRALHASRSGRAAWADGRRYGATLSEVYGTLAEVTGARVIVDSSKWPAHLGLLGQVPQIRPLGLHLVRDPRAVAHSNRRRRSARGRGDAQEMPRFGVTHVAASWIARNLAVELVAGCGLAGWRRQRYEDFARAPRATLMEILDFVGLGGAELPFIDERTIELRATHTVGGNPSKFSVGETVIRPDDEWHHASSGARRTAMTALTVPLLARYGYALGRQGPADV